jgi:hypothetical protein
MDFYAQNKRKRLAVCLPACHEHIDAIVLFSIVISNTVKASLLRPGAGVQYRGNPIPLPRRRCCG